MKKLLTFTLVALMAGCASSGKVGNVDIVNKTPKTMASNASGTYPITMKLKLRNGEIDRDSVDAKIVIDGNRLQMFGNRSGSEFSYDYRMPKDRSSATYYFDVTYRQRGGEGSREKNVKSDVYELGLSNRYVLGLDSVRGTPGTRITVLGRGFSKNDRVYLGEEVAETQFESQSSLKFFVPILPSDKVYAVTVEDDLGAIPAGEFRVDPGILSANPRAFDVRVGKSTTVTIATPMPAPSGGLKIDITTDIPGAISVADAVIQEGRNSVNITVIGVEPASGAIFADVEGHKMLTIPVVVKL
ncbi:MAG: IPT/TIG domain-containing protein [Puniceicoccales bacterium]|jgi:hypothetical protein|nr:IPT/TIG domain-containing protein [Puniceicoccales bacterium]